MWSYLCSQQKLQTAYNTSVIILSKSNITPHSRQNWEVQRIDGTGRPNASFVKVVYSFVNTLNICLKSAFLFIVIAWLCCAVWCSAPGWAGKRLSEKQLLKVPDGLTPKTRARPSCRRSTRHCRNSSLQQDSVTDHHSSQPGGDLLIQRPDRSESCRLGWDTPRRKYALLRLFVCVQHCCVFAFHPWLRQVWISLPLNSPEVTWLEKALSGV